MHPKVTLLLMQLCQGVELHSEAVRETAAACTNFASRDSGYVSHPSSGHYDKLHATVCLCFGMAGGHSVDELQIILKQQLSNYAAQEVNCLLQAVLAAYL